MTGEGVVVKINNGNATVRIEKKSACSGDCSSCGMCENPVYDIEAKNTAGAAVGDKVVLYMPTSKVYKGAFLVYMLPVLIVLGVLGLCSFFAVAPYVTAILCICMLGIWIYVIRRYNNSADLQSEIREIVKELP